MLENTTFQKLDLFPSSGEGRETPTLLGPLERANLKSPESKRGNRKVCSKDCGVACTEWNCDTMGGDSLLEPSMQDVNV
jgi:hypothetical protein